MFIDTANIEEIKKAFDLGIVQGITTNPSILENGSTNETNLVNQISNLDIDHIFFQLKGDTHEEMISYYYSLKEKISRNFGIKIPINIQGLKVIKSIREVDPSILILGTVIYTTAQAIIAVRVGCNYIAPYYSRILNEGGNSDQIIREIRNYIDQNSFLTKIMAASFKTHSQVVSALLSGAHTVTLQYSTLESMLSNKSVSFDLEVFNSTKY